jgi:hypothetical protein
MLSGLIGEVLVVPLYKLLKTLDQLGEFPGA